MSRRACSFSTFTVYGEALLQLNRARVKPTQKLEFRDLRAYSLWRELQPRVFNPSDCPFPYSRTSDLSFLPCSAHPKPSPRFIQRPLTRSTLQSANTELETASSRIALPEVCAAPSRDSVLLPLQIPLSATQPLPFSEVQHAGKLGRLQSHCEIRQFA